jgi:Putative polyhydroxyalkanoic acid system protein (PHA_gran_rgn)
MSPLVVSIPHRLGKDEALKRIRSGIEKARPTFAQVLSMQEETWTDSHLQFRALALGQTLAGSIDVANDQVRIEVALPWAIAQVAEKIKHVIAQQGTLMLDKK